MAIYHHVTILHDYSESGRVVPELNDPQYREIIHAPFRIVYKLTPHSQMIEIIRIWHSARGKPDV